MITVAESVRAHPFFSGMDTPTTERLAACARITTYTEGQVLFSEGEPADAFHLVRSGRVAIQLHRPAGGAVVLDTVDAGGVVGWSWLVPPFRWRFDARAVQPTETVHFDAVRLRALADAEPVLGYPLMRQVTEVMLHRLEAARVRLLDLYGGGR